MRIAIVAAVAENGVIGYRGAVPWEAPEDLRRFRDLTWGHPCVMGRKTWESLPGPLEGRRNLVLSRRTGYAASGAELFASLEDALASCAAESEVFVCGGAEVYRAAMPLADSLHLTEVGLRPAGDTLFPEIPPALFREVRRDEIPSDPRCVFVEYAREPGAGR